MTCEIKSSIKKIVINNLCRIFGNKIVFVGSICDHFYVNMSLDQVKDLDIKVNILEKYYFLHRLLTSDFHVFSEDKKLYKVKPFRTYEPIRNFGIHSISYTSENQPSFKYGYHMHIFGISLDISFYINSYEPLRKYSRFINFPENYDINMKHNYTETLDKMFCLQSAKSRMDTLNQSMNNHRYDETTKNKHLKRWNSYSTYISDKHIIANNFYTQIMDYVPNFVLPKNFDPVSYKKKNDNLKMLTTKDSLIDHYIAHGIFENAKL